MHPRSIELNSYSQVERLSRLSELVRRDADTITGRPVSDEVNNHVHTCYSFSPYTPTAAAWEARWSGLQAIGSVDHDSISAAPEMLDAGKIIGLATTVGCEIRVNFNNTAVEGRRINNPDSTNIVYMVIHGVPADQIDRMVEFLKPISQRRNLRNREQVERLNLILSSMSIRPITFDEVGALSKSAENGSITERHILLALAIELVSSIGQGQSLRRWVEDHLQVRIPDRLRHFLDDDANPHYHYDLIGILKSTFLPRFFVQPDNDECISVVEAVNFARDIGAIPAYAYLGDVGDSPTGDKKAEKFEDDFLDELMDEVSRIGFRAVTYMPPRNTREQLRRIIRLCHNHNLMQISGVDINSSRQLFTCPEILDPEFHHLIDMTWALIAHEKLASVDPRYALFGDDNPLGGSLQDRLASYSQIGRSMDPHRPNGIMDDLRLHYTPSRYRRNNSPLV